MPLPSTDNAKFFLIIRLLPPHQFLRKLLENSRRHIQSSTSPPSHLLKYTSIKHCHFGSDCGATAIHRQCHTIPYHQAIASTSILAQIAWAFPHTSQNTHRWNIATTLSYLPDVNEPLHNAFHLPQWAFPHKSFIHTQELVPPKYIPPLTYTQHQT